MTVPNTFVSGTLISASEVNENFAALDTQTATLADDLASSAAGKGDALVGQSNGKTARENSPIYIWRKLPSLIGGGTAGTPTENALRLQAQLDTLAAQGGGILQLVEEAVDIDRPLVPAAKVSIIGPGMGRALLRNTYSSTFAGCDFRQSPVIRTGNIAIGYTGTAGSAATDLWVNANSKPLNAVAFGDMAATLTTAGDASGYAVGDYVIFFSSVFYLNAGLQLAEYMTIRKITKISGAILYVDNPFNSAFTGYAYNMRTGTVLGAPTTATGVGSPLYAYAEAEIAGFDVDTIWHWKGGDASTYSASFADINVRRSRTIAYGNMHFYSTFDNVGGRFTQSFSELAQNSEMCVVRNFNADYDAAEGTATGTPGFFAGITQGENVVNNTFENGFVNCGAGFGISNPVIKANNAEGVVVNRVNFVGTTAFAANVLDIGNNLTAIGRREAIKGNYNISWSGGCRRYLSLSNVNTAGNVIAGNFRGTPTVQGAVVASVQGLNVIQPTTFMEQGSLGFNSTTANLSCNGPYIGGGVAALTTTDYSFLVANDIRNIRTANTVARRPGTTSRASAYTVTTTEADVLATAIGTATIQRQDEITFSVNVDITGNTGTKTIRFKITDTTTPTIYTIVECVIPAAASGQVTVKGKVNVTSPSAIYADEATCSVSTATITNAAITADLSAKAITLSVTAIKAAAGDTVVVRAARVALANPVQI